MKVKQLVFLVLFATSGITVADDDKSTRNLNRGGWRPTVIEVNERPEGITNGPIPYLYVSQILSGRVLAISARTGESKVVVGRQNNKQSWGLWYYWPEEALFVCGGGDVFGGGRNEVYLYDVSVKKGKLLVTCSPKSTNPNENFGSFINDVTVRDGKAYITDSFWNRLMVLDVDQALDGECDVSEIKMPNAFKPENADDFGANGIVPFARGLLVSHEGDGSVWYLNLQDNKWKQIIDDGVAPGADGLAMSYGSRPLLYVTQNINNEIGVFSLSVGKDGEEVEAVKLGSLTSPKFDTPATSALYQGYIYSTNSLFYNESVAFPDAAADKKVTQTVIAVRDYFGSGKCYH